MDTQAKCVEHDAPQVIGSLTGLPLCYCTIREQDPSLKGCLFQEEMSR